MLLLSTPPADRHTPFEDLQGIVVGITLMALSVQFLSAADLFTGQIAGLSLILTYPTGWSFGLLFFLLNLPFYVLAVRQLGWTFMVKSLVAVTCMAALADMLAHFLAFDALPPWLGATLFGILAGAGLVMLFRHGTTLGGVGIVALWLQDTRGIKAGHTQLAFDLCVFLGALFLFPWPAVAWSLLGAAIVNVIMTINHRRDRYIARS